jgi:hypothetical protein
MGSIPFQLHAEFEVVLRNRSAPTDLHPLNKMGSLLSGFFGSLLLRVGALSEISKSRFKSQVFLPYKHESFFPDFYSCLFLVSLTIAELAGVRGSKGSHQFDDLKSIGLGG